MLQNKGDVGKWLICNLLLYIWVLLAVLCDCWLNVYFWKLSSLEWNPTGCFRDSASKKAVQKIAIGEFFLFVPIVDLHLNLQESLRFALSYSFSSQSNQTFAEKLCYKYAYAWKLSSRGITIASCCLLLFGLFSFFLFFKPSEYNS